jgi:hypothetical protein
MAFMEQDEDDYEKQPVIRQCLHTALRGIQMEENDFTG